MTGDKVSSLVTADLQTEIANGNEIEDLLRILIDALAFWPPLYAHSILGWPLSWLPPYKRYSEFNIIDIRKLKRTINYLMNVTVPAVPSEGPEGLPDFIKDHHWRPTTIYSQPDQKGNYASFPEEAWFFINGVATNRSVAEFNSTYLAKLFHRPLTVIQNATDSLLLDLVQCAIGKGWSKSTEPAVKALPLISEALENENKKKVVVVCHSQGTIIMSNVLRALKSIEFKEKLFELHRRQFPDIALVEPNEYLSGAVKENLRKLEIFAFANCATDMTYYDSELSFPFIENYGNENDLVARLGMLAPKKTQEKIDIDGANYLNADMWGHLLNQHYLFKMHTYLSNPKAKKNPYAPLGNGEHVPSQPRIYGYYHGAEPEPYLI